jgi:hypothetical protein
MAEEYTYGFLINLADEVVGWTEIDGETIEGNSVLEEKRIYYVKSLEDMISNGMATMGIHYVRPHENMYSEKKNV